jgi:hypothetical protein
MKANDKDLVKNLYSTHKVVEPKTKKNVPAIINRMIDYIKKKERPCSLTELQAEIKELDLRSKEFLSALSKYSEKLKLDERGEMLSLKSKYALYNIEDLKDKIRTNEYGLLEDEELKDSYPGIKNDIEKLKRENYVKVIYNTDKLCNVLYYRDSSDKFEQKLVQPEFSQAIQELRKIWKDELNYYDVNDKTQVFIKKRLPGEEIKKKSEKKRKITKWANDHIYDNFNSKIK